MNGIGQLIINCLDVFPTHFESYQQNKEEYKRKLPMRSLSNLLQEKRRVKTFIEKSFFGGNQVDYLTIKHDEIFHVFRNKDIANVMGDYFEVINSRARRKEEMDAQKVIFKYKNHNVGELEVRNSGANH